MGLILMVACLPWAGHAEEEMQDAFAPVVQAQTVTQQITTMAAPATLNLEAISLGGDSARVVIDGEIYRPGDIKNGVEIVQIRRREVDIISSGISQTLRLYQDDPSAVAIFSSERGKAPKKEVIQVTTTETVETEKPQSMQDLLKDL